MPERVQTIPTYTTKPTYYTEAIKEYLLKRATFLGDEQQRANLLYRGGLEIHTTFDPNLQALAEQARTQLPENAVRDSTHAIVTLDTKTGAIRAMVGGHGFQPRVAEINMALVPRQTGSSIKIFILAAALQAGVQPDDVLDGTTPCTFADPNDRDEAVPHQGCDRSRRRHAAATHVVVDQLRVRPPVADRRAAPSRRHDVSHGALAVPLPGSDGPCSDRSRTRRTPPAPMRCARSTWRRACRRSPTTGLHHDPYYVDYIERADGTRLYTHDDPGVQVLDPGVALTAVSVLKGVLDQRHCRQDAGQLPVPGGGQDRHAAATTPTRGSSVRRRS